MGNQKIFVAGLLAGVAMFITGFLLWAVLLEGFFQSNSVAPAGVMKEQGEMVWWALILSQLFMGYLLAYIFGKWASISTLKTGFTAGLFIGFFVGLSFDLAMYATSNFMNLTGTIGDILTTAVWTGVGGAVAGWWLGRN